MNTVTSDADGPESAVAHPRVGVSAVRRSTQVILLVVATAFGFGAAEALSGLPDPPAPRSCSETCAPQRTSPPTATRRLTVRRLRPRSSSQFLTVSTIPGDGVSEPRAIREPPRGSLPPPNFSENKMSTIRGAFR